MLLNFECNGADVVLVGIVALHICNSFHITRFVINGYSTVSRSVGTKISCGMGNICLRKYMCIYIFSVTHAFCKSLIVFIVPSKIYLPSIRSVLHLHFRSLLPLKATPTWHSLLCVG